MVEGTLILQQQTNLFVLRNFQWGQNNDNSHIMNISGFPLTRPNSKSRTRIRRTHSQTSHRGSSITTHPRTTQSYQGRRREEQEVGEEEHEGEVGVSKEEEERKTEGELSSSKGGDRVDAESRERKKDKKVAKASFSSPLEVVRFSRPHILSMCYHLWYFYAWHHINIDLFQFYIHSQVKKISCQHFSSSPTSNRLALNVLPPRSRRRWLPRWQYGELHWCLCPTFNSGLCLLCQGLRKTLLADSRQQSWCLTLKSIELPRGIIGEELFQMHLMWL